MKINNSSNHLNINEIILQIVYFIKHNDDFDSAARIMEENSISIEELNLHTIKLSQLELAKLADKILESRR